MLPMNKRQRRRLMTEEEETFNPKREHDYDVGGEH
jgi:hypothetical protein